MRVILQVVGIAGSVFISHILLLCLLTVRLLTENASRSLSNVVTSLTALLSTSSESVGLSGHYTPDE